MGEYAEMMLEGSFCEGCGEYLGEPCGFPQYCVECEKQITLDELEKEFGQK